MSQPMDSDSGSTRTKRFYSFVVEAPYEVVLPHYRLILDPGMNVFNAMVTDLPAFEAALTAHGVKVTQANCLDALDPITPSPEVLEAGTLPLFGK